MLRQNRIINFDFFGVPSHLSNRFSWKILINHIKVLSFLLSETVKRIEKFCFYQQLFLFENSIWFLNFCTKNADFSKIMGTYGVIVNFQSSHTAVSLYQISCFLHIPNQGYGPRPKKTNSFMTYIHTI